MPLISFSCLISLGKISNTILYKSSESEHLRFVPDLRGNIFNYFPFHGRLAIGLSYIPFIMLKYGSFVLFLGFFPGDCQGVNARPCCC